MVAKNAILMVLRLVLGDQLNYEHSWLNSPDKNVVYFMCEMHQETNYVKHHVQKIIAFFDSMRNYAKFLEQQGHQIIYYKLDHECSKLPLEKILDHVITKNQITTFEYQYPDEYRLDAQLKNYCDQLGIPSRVYDTEHFYTSRKELTDFFEGKKQFTMEFFYRYMRKKHQIMMLDAKNPEGGKWNFDGSNRKKWTGKHLIPPNISFSKNVSEINQLLKVQGIETIGSVNENQFTWPTNRSESLKALNYFCEHLLVHFGDYQDAMYTDQYYLFHSNLSFAMNTKMLSPQEIIDAVISHWRKKSDKVAISQVEGFVRQIVGWREYMRGIYWRQMPNYISLNKLENTNSLPSFYWTGKTKMNCLRSCINQSLQTGYAHHIQRLMVTGNYALLTQSNPNEVDQWYLGIYTDAIEWVQLPNTRGMSQYADGGIVATKPYISSGSYINKMSNYCKSCYYKVNDKTGEKACPFNALYWNFLHNKRDFLQNNNRMSMMYSLLDKMDRETLTTHLEKADHIINHPNDY